MVKEKKNKPSKELPLGFVDRQEKELLVRDFIISNIKEIMIKYKRIISTIRSHSHRMHAKLLLSL